MRLKKYLNEAVKTRDDIIQMLFKDCKPYLNTLGIRSPDDINKNMTKFYRGERIKLSDITKIDVKKRFSKGTVAEFFPIVNQWLKSKGHVSRDHAVFCTSNKTQADNFGNNLGIVFPIGSFKYSFVRADDFNYNFSGDGWDSFALVWELREKLCNATKHVLTSDVWLTETTKRELNDKVLLNYLKKTSKDIFGNPIEVEVSSLSTGGGTSIDTIDNWDKRAKAIWQNFESNTNLLEAEISEYEIWFDCKSYYFVKEDILY